ncbi:unnamed protein product, partial [Rotaria sordida]
MYISAASPIIFTFLAIRIVFKHYCCFFREDKIHNNNHCVNIFLISFREMSGLMKATNESLKDIGYLITSPGDVTVQNGKFDIVPWPTKGWRALDPNTGNEAGTTEGSMEIYWEGDRLYGKNHAIATDSNHYLLGYGNLPLQSASLSNSNISEQSEISSVFVWYSDYHPDGGQLFFPTNGKSFISNLAPAVGDDITPDHFTAFY